MDRTSKREAIKACLGVDPELARENLVDGTPQQRKDLLKKGNFSMSPSAYHSYSKPFSFLKIKMPFT